VSCNSVWIVGGTHNGKTNRLIQQLHTWADSDAVQGRSRLFSTFLIFAATGDNRLFLADRIATATQGQYRFESVTPLGFLHDEVALFFPMLAQTLNLKTQFPLRLRPETEQELATQLWRSKLDEGKLRQEGVQEYFVVRRTLDLLQLAAVSGISHEEIPLILSQGLETPEANSELWQHMGQALEQWVNWCLERGFLTYGIAAELYWRCLLPNPIYQQHLKRRYHAVLADDVDEYPAIAYSLFTFFLNQKIPAAFTYNPNGGVRLGLGADPNYLSGLAKHCHHVETLTPDAGSLAATWGTTLLNYLREPMPMEVLPEAVQSIQTTSRAELLRQTAAVIVRAVQTGQVQPQEIAIVAPGMDTIARYTLREILSSRNIPVLSLNDQRPLVSSPLVRALLTLLALVYPKLGRLLSREAVAEMLVLLSQGSVTETRQTTDQTAVPASSLIPALTPAIDPVRAGLLTDHCFVPDPEQPHLLPVSAFPRWDRLGYQATQAYEAILHWLETQQQQQQQRLIPSPVVLLDRAIQRFLFGGSHLPYDQLSALRELMETAQHYWDVDLRLRQHTPARTDAGSVGRFIRLLRDGTITADPYPVRPMGKAGQAVTLATVYQYRSDRQSHRWQFWLDAGSSSWLTGGGGLYGAPLFLQGWSGQSWTAMNTLEADQRRLERQVLDLLSRASERIFLCYSELATNGQEQAGALLSLVNAAIPVNLEVAQNLPVQNSPQR